jgi:hypothetical protein
MYCILLIGSFMEDPDKMSVTAEAGADFSLRNRTFTFLPGVRRMNLTIDIQHDGEVESAELFSVNVVSPDGNRAAIGETCTAYVKIEDSTDIGKSL